MSPIEMARVVAVVVFLAVAGYSAARVVWSVTRRQSRAGVADLSHALMGLAMALMVSPAGTAVPAPLGIAAFTVLAAWFAARLRREGLLSRAALALPGRTGGGLAPAAGPEGRPDGDPGRWPGGTLGHRPGAPGRLPDLTSLTGRDRHAAGHGGYHLHHLVGCAAMVAMYVTGHGALATEAISATATAATTATSAAQEAVALDVHGAHATMPVVAALCWAFALYFLVAATSLGFRVGEPATPHPPSAGTRPATTPTTARLLTSPAGACATEVALSAGMAVLFFSAL